MNENKKSIFKNKVAKTATAVGALMCTAVPAAFAETGTAGATLASDAETVTSMATSVMGLFGTYPLNIILAMSLLGGVIGIIIKLKKGANKG